MATFNVRVRRGPFSGMAADGVRLNIVPGIYSVDHNGNTLVFARADTRTGGNIVVDLQDYIEIGVFPDDISVNSQIEIV
ncbi:hypothetical protein [Burkholderia pseudomallei]|uniref:hypothetical protein n=1 Tax=Burkholderia pseudomallei TaxID=28450 RepID=UPI00293DDA8B|nr:Uncharacterised protein [Burkholderia pseudomallei]CAJ7032721.1 Uncharacterised protein [Burkholderia pseudomallei]CAJ7825441.1 Uncharacterised protein [Burkholderia pseudomallei]